MTIWQASELEGHPDSEVGGEGMAIPELLPSALQPAVLTVSLLKVRVALQLISIEASV